MDYYSNFSEHDYLEKENAEEVINKLKNQFSRHGIPDVVYSDNGPQLDNKKFRDFANKWSSLHITSSPRFQQRLFNRRTKTPLPMTTELFKQKYSTNDRQRNIKEKQRIVKYYNRGKKGYKKLYPGQIVRIQPEIGAKSWKKGVIIGESDDTGRSYIVETENGNKLRRNRVHLRKSSEKQVIAHEKHKRKTLIAPPINNNTDPKNPKPTNKHSTNVRQEPEARHRKPLLFQFYPAIVESSRYRPSQVKSPIRESAHFRPSQARSPIHESSHYHPPQVKTPKTDSPRHCPSKDQQTCTRSGRVVKLPAKCM